jgi:hypothetical protein
MTRGQVRGWVVGALALGLLGMGLPARADAPLSSASAGPGTARSSALGVPGVLTVSESAIAPGYAQWSVLSVLGTSLLGHTNGQWSGALAGAGPAVDRANQVLCDTTTSTVPVPGLVACVNVLPGGASSDSRYAVAGGGAADAQVGLESPSSQPVRVRALSSNAYTSDYASCWATSSADLVVVDGRSGLGQPASATSDLC